MANIICNEKHCTHNKEGKCKAKEVEIDKRGYHGAACKTYKHDVTKSRECWSCEYYKIEDDPGDDRLTITICRKGHHISSFGGNNISCWEVAKRYVQQQ